MVSSKQKAKRKANSEETKKRRCKGTCPDGSRCKKKARPGSDFCFSHDPTTAERRSEISRMGGLVPRKPELPACEELTVSKCRQLLSACSEMLLKGEIGPGVARSLAAILREDRSMKEHGELMARLEKLEEEED